MNINDLLVELDRRDTLLANDAASKIRELLKENERMASDREVLLEALTRIGNWGGTTKFTGSGSYTDVARAAIQKVTK